VTNWLRVARIPACQTIDSSRYCSLATSIAQVAYPFRKLKGAANLDHL
jgi:hypothetical protein